MEIIKDLFVSLLVVICIIMVLTIFFYDDIAIGKVIPEAETYTLTNDMQNALENSELDETEEIIINYYIDASDLKKYEKTNEYDKGKSNPFAPREINNNIDNTTEGDNNSSSTNNNSNSNQNFYEDDGTK